MTATLTALLFCIGLVLGTRNGVQVGILPKPRLWAEPGSLIPWGQPVTLWCEGPPGAREYDLYRDGSQVLCSRKTSLEFRNKAKFSILFMTEQRAGQLHCYYRTSSGWSAPSDPLDMLISDHLPATPSLSVHLGPTWSSGKNVTLLCQSRSPMDTFLLFKAGSSNHPMRVRSESRAQRSQAQFSMGTVNSALGGTYRCYGSRNSSPYLLSQPSAPLELTVLGGPQNQPLSPDSGPQHASLAQDYTVGNLVRMGLAGLVLVVLGILLFEAQHSQRKTQHAPRN